MKTYKALIPVAAAMLALTACPPQSKNVAVTSVSLNKESLTLNINDAETLIATVNPSDATNKTVTWTSDNANVASVTNGEVKGLSSGTSTITVKTNDGNFTDDCLVTVVDPSSLTEVNVNFVNMSNKIATATTDLSVAKPGDVITVTYALKEAGGYESYDYTLVDSNDAAIKTTKISDNKFSYNLPTDGYAKFSITNLVGKEIRAYVTDSNGLIASNPEISTDGINYKAVPDGEPFDTRTMYKLVYGASVRMKLAAKGNFKPTGIEVDGVSYKCDENDLVYFVANVEDPNDKDTFFLEINVTYKDETPGDYTIEFNSTTHITVEIYQSDKETKVSKTSKDETLYIKTTAVDDYVVQSIKVIAVTSDIGTTSETIPTSIGDGWYQFKVPFSYTKTIRIQTVEKFSNLLKNTGTIGTYLSLYLASADHVLNEFDNKQVSISEDGTMNKDSVTANAVQVFDNYFTVDNPGSGRVYYGNNIILFNEDGIGICAPFGSYDIISVKKNDPSDSNALYTVEGERFIVDNKVYVAIRFFYSGKEYGTAFLDYAKKEAYFGVTFNFIVGESLYDDKLLYEVRSEKGELINVIGYDGTGGYGARCLLNEYYGVYTNETSELLIAGQYKAHYNDNDYSYEIDGNTITLTSETEKITGTLNNGGRTFTVTNTETLESDLPVFAGHTYRSNDAFEDDVTWYAILVEFDATSKKFKCIVDCQNKFTFDNHSTRAFAYNEAAEYTLEESGSYIIMTANMKISNGSMKKVNFKYDPNSDKFTVSCKDIYTGHNGYASTATLTREK